jgi:ABC-type glycerol-3-phosphate transport system substrate-binding protein
MGVDSAKNIYAISVTPPEGPKSGGEDSNSRVNVPYHIFKYTLKSGTKADENKKTITAVVRRSERYLQTAVSLFQKNNPDYKIELEYMDSTDNNESYMQNLNTNILSGKGPDILQTSRLPYDKYTSKDILVDLNELISKDKSFDVNQYYTNILDGVKVNGHMYFMPIMFTFNALLANKGILDEAGITIDSSKWTWNDFKTAAGKVVQKDADGNVIRTALPNVSPSDLLSWFVMLGDFSRFVDNEKKTSSFDSPDFMQMLELVKSFGDNNLTSKGNFKSSMADVTEAAYRGAIVFLPEPIQGYIDYGMVKGMFAGKVSVLSFPSENASASGTFNANETYGIASYSKYKDAAWEFIKTLISEKIQSNMQMGGFAVNKAAQKNLADQALEQMSNGNVKMNMEGKEFSLDKITREDINYIDSMIPKLNKYFSIDNQVVQIVMDEAAAYFSGDKSVEETAKLIQNRVNTYLNE